MFTIHRLAARKLHAMLEALPASPEQSDAGLAHDR